MNGVTWTDKDGIVRKLPHFTFIEKFIRSLKHVKFGAKIARALQRFATFNFFRQFLGRVLRVHQMPRKGVKLFGIDQRAQGRPPGLVTKMPQC